MRAAPQDSMSIGALAKAAGVGVETIRFYQQRRLLRQPARPYGGIRRYDESDLARLRFIRSAQRMGFSLDEIGSLLALEDGAQCREAAELANVHLAEVRARLADLARIEAALMQLTVACQRRRGRVTCPLIATLHGERAATLSAPSARPPHRRARTGRAAPG